MIIFPENTHLRIEQVSLEKTLTVLISSTEATSVCTSCGMRAIQIHSRYRRHLSDLPVSGYPVTLLVEVRRFFCHHPSCPRKTFAETFLPFAARYAQRTNRLQEALQQLGLDVGAQVGAKTGARMGLASSPSRLLRLIRKAKLTSPPHLATCIGIDDWAYKRRRRYGTLICDLETGKPLDLLPDRTVQTVSTWLQEHPEIKIISHDRWSEYATAAQKGAPQARQGADRWHMLHNLTESVATLVARIRAEVTPSEAIKKNEPSSTHKARQQQYQELETLSHQGLGPQQIDLDPLLEGRRREICYNRARRIQWANLNQPTQKNSNNKLFNCLKVAGKTKHK